MPLLGAVVSWEGDVSGPKVRSVEGSEGADKDKGCRRPVITGQR